MLQRSILQSSVAIAGLALAFSVGAAAAQEPLKIGLIQSMTGAFNTVGKAAVNGARLYVQQHGDTVAGRKIQLIVKDDATSPEAAKRLAQELIVNDKVAIIGAGITPSAVIADWATQNGTKKIVTIVNDWAPGLEAEAAFKDRISKGGVQILESMRVPLANPDFAPFLQRARDLGPDTIFAYFPGNQSGIFAKQFVERGMDKSGIRLIGPGDLTDDDELPGMTDAMLGIVTALHYSALHDSALNKAYVKDFEAAYGKRPNFVSLGGYDGMHLIYEALKKTGGKTDGDAMLAAMKGMKWESPRGPMSIDPETRDVVHNEYIRKVEKVNGQLYNVELSTIEAVKDPVRGAKK